MKKIIKETSDFRQYEPEKVKDGRGKTITIQLCEECVEGRWESFYSIISK
ncbi:MAG: hypothetical protein ABIA67_04215 [Candidatus Margulisiibacteriota bacterium]